MKKIMIKIQYVGKNYVGWQNQKNGISVQQVLEENISKLLGEKISLIASGRTDAGVNAICQVAHFETKSNFLVKNIAKAVNSFLPFDIRVLFAEEVDNNFHARFSAKKKTYVYKLYQNDILLPLKNNFVCQIKENINLAKMKKFAKLFVGNHNFKAFCSAKTQTNNFIRKIYYIHIHNVFDEIHIEICGNGFLYNMVRMIVGALIEVGKGKLSKNEIKYMLKTGDKIKFIKTMPPYALYLKNVEY